MAKEANINPSTLRQLIEYDPETGALTWKLRDISHFPDERACNSWNTRFAGKVAFSKPYPSGYLTIRVLGVRMYAHRVAFAIYHGSWPLECTDHIDGDRANNCITNLRSVSYSENSRNAGLRSDNRSGVTGVSFISNVGKWRARIGIDGEEINLGEYTSLEQAAAARRSAEVELEFSERHGL